MVVGSILFSLSSSSCACAFAFAASVGYVAVLYSGDYVMAFVFVAAFAVGFAFWLSVLGECFGVGKSATEPLLDGLVADVEMIACGDY